MMEEFRTTCTPWRLIRTMPSLSSAPSKRSDYLIPPQYFGLHQEETTELIEQC